MTYCTVPVVVTHSVCLPAVTFFPNMSGSYYHGETRGELRLDRCVQVEVCCLWEASQIESKADNLTWLFRLQSNYPWIWMSGFQAGL